MFDNIIEEQIGLIVFDKKRKNITLTHIHTLTRTHPKIHKMIAQNKECFRTFLTIINARRNCRWRKHADLGYRFKLEILSVLFDVQVRFHQLTFYALIIYYTILRCRMKANNPTIKNCTAQFGHFYDDRLRELILRKLFSYSICNRCHLFPCQHCQLECMQYNCIACS